MVGIVWGIKALKPHISSHPEIVCKDCNTKGNIDVYIYPQYVHVLWIPFFSGGKLFESHCKSCGHTITRQSLQKIPEDFKTIAQKEKKATKTPWYSYTGIYLITLYALGVFLFNMQQNWQRDNYTKKYLSQPQVNDIYVIKNNTEKYRAMKIINVSQNNISFISNNSDLYRPSDAEKMELDESSFENNRFSKKLSFSKSELESLFQKGDIYQIIRK